MRALKLRRDISRTPMPEGKITQILKRQMPLNILKWQIRLRIGMEGKGSRVGGLKMAILEEARRREGAVNERSFND